MLKLEIRSEERGICPIATFTMNELFLLWPDAWRMHKTAIFPLPV